MELGVANPVPALNAPAVPQKLQQGFWGGSQAGVAPRGAPGEALQMRGFERLTAAAADRGHLHDPAGAAPGDGTTMTLLENTCLDGDVARGDGEQTAPDPAGSGYGSGSRAPPPASDTRLECGPHAACGQPVSPAGN